MIASVSKRKGNKRLENEELKEQLLKSLIVGDAERKTIRNNKSKRSEMEE
jgi:hypothetical protein